jgi:hypothetical protein
VLCLIFVGADLERRRQDVEATDDTLDSSDLVIQAVRLVSHLTGHVSPAQTDEPWNIYGADLGFSFESNDIVYVVFGDTWGRQGIEGPDSRSNTMAIIEPDRLHGYVVADVVKDGAGEARELLPSLKVPKTEYTVIPIAGIAVGDRLCLHYMSIRDWDATDWGYRHPAVNGAGLTYSDDREQSWVKDRTAWWPGDTAFTQAAMAAGSDDDSIYLYGTPAGRFGALKLLRVPRGSLLVPERYEYWSGSAWSSDPGRAADVVPAPVGELSVRWSPYHERWLMMYLNEADHTIVLRTAQNPEGLWDAGRVVVTAGEYPTLYAPFMLPITGPDISFTISTFRAYQVFVMRFTLRDAQRGRDRVPRR